MESLNERIKLKLDQIADCIFQRIQEPLPYHIGGLYGGEWGNLLFLCYYAKYKNDQQILETAETYAERLLTHSRLDKLSHTFCDGYAGILYLLQFLKEQELLQVDTEDVEQLLENYIIDRMRYDFNIVNYDFLHGALGCGYYFLKKHKDIKPVNELINFLYDTAEKDIQTHCFKWKSLVNFEKGSLGYNISLSHGMASIVLFLSHALEKGIKNEKASVLLNNTTNYVLSQEINVQKYGCFFPHQSLENEEYVPQKTRLGWCYGDLGVAYALWVAGKVTDNKEWSHKGLNILLHSAQRKGITDNLIVDAGICHGTSGISMVFKKMYLSSDQPLFLDAAGYWLLQSLEIASFSDGLAGYKAYVLKEWVSNYCLLMGIAGTGMVYMSYLMDDQHKWDQLFLL
jgi:hypothetical protein